MVLPLRGEVPGAAVPKRWEGRLATDVPRARVTSGDLGNWDVLMERALPLAPGGTSAAPRRLFDLMSCAESPRTEESALGGCRSGGGVAGRGTLVGGSDRKRQSPSLAPYLISTSMNPPSNSVVSGSNTMASGHSKNGCSGGRNRTSSRLHSGCIRYTVEDPTWRRGFFCCFCVTVVSSAVVDDVCFLDAGLDD